MSWFLWSCASVVVVFGTLASVIGTNRSRRTYMVLGWRKLRRWIVEGRPKKQVTTFPVYGSDDEEEGEFIKED